MKGFLGGKGLYLVGARGEAHRAKARAGTYI
jgi:hypothetical protein